MSSEVAKVKNMKTINYKNSVVKYTVELNNLKKGTITAVEQEKIKVGDFEKNVQFIDEHGNFAGRNGTIIKIISEEIIG